MTTHLRLGTRSSALALRQAEIIARQLRRCGVEVTIVASSSAGDHDSQPLPGRSREGIFVHSLRDQLRDGSVDFLVHSFKDVPVGHQNDVVIAAVAERADPRDVLLSDHGPLSSLESGARVGTCSTRRAAWVHRHRPDLRILPIRGAIDHRMEQLKQGDFDAIILAAAGIDRLGAVTPTRYDIAIDDLVPAPAQGALALECRRGDIRTAGLLKRIDHVPTRLAVTAERAVLLAIDPDESEASGAVCLVRGKVAVLLADHAPATGVSRHLVHLRASLDLGSPLEIQVLRLAERAIAALTPLALPCAS